jgi:hypothetical protein
MRTGLGLQQPTPPSHLYKKVIKDALTKGEEILPAGIRLWSQVKLEDHNRQLWRPCWTPGPGPIKLTDVFTSGFTTPQSAPLLPSLVSLLTVLTAV